jgi:hypothetical protein
MATLEKRIADLELRVGMDDTGLRLVIIKPVQNVAQGCVVESLTTPADGKAWKRADDESEADFLHRVRAELAQVASGPVLLIANTDRSEVAA